MSEKRIKNLTCPCNASFETSSDTCNKDNKETVQFHTNVLGCMKTLSAHYCAVESH